MKRKELAPFLFILFFLPYVIVLLLIPSAEESIKNRGEYRKTPPEENTVSGYEWRILVKREGVLERMDLETYVCGATAAVLPKNSETEFIKAQMILVRTNIMRELMERMEEMPEPEIPEEVLSEQYKSIEDWARVSGEDKKSAMESLYEAAKDTRGIILTCDGLPIEASYHAVSNGTTREAEEVLNREIPYLTRINCPDDRYAKEYFYRKEYSEDLWENEEIEILDRDSAGYVLLVRVGNKTVTGEAFRRQYDLYSADFSITKGEGRWIVTTKGCGHGLGMSQYTANQMAKAGSDCEAILLKFFPGTECKKIE